MKRISALLGCALASALSSAEKLQVQLIDPNKLFNDLARASNISKDPFETSSQFADRAAKRVGAVIRSNRLFISVETMAAYEADTETAIISGPSRLLSGTTHLGFVSIPVSHTVANRPSEKWANAFGRQMTVKIASVTSAILLCENSPSIFENLRLQLSFPLARAQAKKRLSSLKIALEATVIRPTMFSTELVGVTRPTFEEPQKITFIDRRLRVVLKKAFVYDPKTKEIIYSRKFETLLETEERVRAERAAALAAKERAASESRKHPMLDGVIADPSYPDIARILEVQPSSRMYANEVITGISFSKTAELQLVKSWADVRKIIAKAPGDSVIVHWSDNDGYGEREIKLVFRNQ